MKHLLMIAAILFLLAPAAALTAELLPPCCSLGDINGSGNVSTLDIVLISRHVLGIDCMDETAALCNADVDGDGTVTQEDVDLISAYVLRIIDTFPRCGDLDSDGQLEWASQGDDLNFFTSCFFGGGKGCENGDADNDGDFDFDDIVIFMDHADGLIQNFPGCACGEGACGP